VLQRVSETQVAERRTLPSFIYLPGEHELPAEALALPWIAEQSALVGEFARRQGARVPPRLIASAKSWLCHPRVDRTAPILPWDAPGGVERISPLEASARYLAHLRESWDFTHAKDARLVDQEIILTVPASFNEVARELTVQAATLAGFVHLTLLEEPQAAFYSWLARHEHDWLEQLGGTRSILVCDIGGGTTDFTLIKVEAGADRQPAFRRVAVGEHLMLGGDNMDLALAHVVESALGARFDSNSWGILTHECRGAKERLLAADAPAEWTVSIPGRGSRLLGGMTSAPLLREEVQQIILEGFFPLTPYHEKPEQSRRAGLSEWGLPYAADPAVSRHLSAFLSYQCALEDPQLLPDAVLFNGAALEPAILRNRILDLIESWSGTRPRELENRDLDLAVAHGAAHYAQLRDSGGQRITGGLARSYYVGVAAADGPAQAACLIPRGLEEGQTVEIREPTFQVVVDRPVAFPLYASTVRPQDQAGTLVALSGDFDALPPLATVLNRRGRRGKGAGSSARPDASVPSATPAPAEHSEFPTDMSEYSRNIPRNSAEMRNVPEDEGQAGDIEPPSSPSRNATESTRPGERRWTPQPEADADAPPEPAEIPVHLKARVNDIGTLELWCVGADEGQEWRLQFQVRGAPSALPEDGLVATAASEDRVLVKRAARLVATAFHTKAGKLNEASLKPRGLMWGLEETLRERRDAWSLGLLRELWEALDRVKNRRRSGEAFEGPWLNATGFCLRPGFGWPLDDWRTQRTWDIFEAGLQYPRHVPARSEWWVLWRRVCGGLDAISQQIIFAQIAPHLLPGRKHIKTRLGPPLSSAETLEMLRLAASLERLEPDVKATLGEVALERLERRAATLEYWMLARLGTRVPFAGSPHQCVSPEVAESWIRSLLGWTWKDVRTAGFAVCQMGRVTNDRTRDLDPDVREQAAARLRNEGLHDMARPLEEYVEMEAADQAAVAGEALPVGLRLGTPQT
jgi:hypothetical protein